MTKYQHQHDINGCGIACIANLLNLPYQQIKQDFEAKFYKINKGIKVFDMVSFLNGLGMDYTIKFFNHNKYDPILAEKYSKIPNSITLIRKNQIYPVGHYLLRTDKGWIDPWFNFPSIDGVHAGLRQELVGYPWYVVYPKKRV
jgi:hypothetical protein